MFPSCVQRCGWKRVRVIIFTKLLIKKKNLPRVVAAVNPSLFLISGAAKREADLMNC